VNLEASIVIAQADFPLPFGVAPASVKLGATIVWNEPAGSEELDPSEASCVQGQVSMDFTTTIDCSDEHPFRSFGEHGGTWSAVESDQAFFTDRMLNQTLLRDSEASFEPDALVGLFVGPPLVSRRDVIPASHWKLIIANDTRSIRVWDPTCGEGVGVRAGDRYGIYDLTPRAAAPTLDRSRDPYLRGLDLLGQPPVDAAGTGVDPSIEDIGAYEQTGFTLGRCLSDCQ
jgi:hypothetical protein